MADMKSEVAIEMDKDMVDAHDSYSYTFQPPDEQLKRKAAKATAQKAQRKARKEARRKANAEIRSYDNGEMEKFVQNRIHEKHLEDMVADLNCLELYQEQDSLQRGQETEITDEEHRRMEQQWAAERVLKRNREERKFKRRTRNAWLRQKRGDVPSKRQRPHKARLSDSLPIKLNAGNEAEKGNTTAVENVQRTKEAAGAKQSSNQENKSSSADRTVAGTSGAESRGGGRKRKRRRKTNRIVGMDVEMSVNGQ